MATDGNSEAEPRVAVVTGGSRGVGRSVVEQLAGDGLNVVVVYASNKSGAQAAVAAVESRGAAAIALGADVADEQAVSELFDEAERTFGGVEVVVNAAGMTALAALVDFDLAVLDQMHRTNIRGTFVIDQQAASRVRNGGAIINFSSSVIGRIAPTYTGYAASRAPWRP